MCLFVAASKERKKQNYVEQIFTKDMKDCTNFHYNDAMWFLCVQTNSSSRRSSSSRSK